jgi:toxin FitB
LNGYLLDTDIVSAFAPGAAAKPPLAPALVAWFKHQEERLFLSAVTALELEAGLIKLGRTAPGARHEQLTSWFAAILTFYAERVLPLDLRVARVASVLTDQGKARGRYPGLADVAIAATSVAHGLTLLSRNLQHFHPLGIDAIDPFERLPS